MTSESDAGGKSIPQIFFQIGINVLNTCLTRSWTEELKKALLPFYVKKRIN
jgi:hypothetical protein